MKQFGIRTFSVILLLTILVIGSGVGAGAQASASFSFAGDAPVQATSIEEDLETDPQVSDVNTPIPSFEKRERDSSAVSEYSSIAVEPLQSIDVAFPSLSTNAIVLTNPRNIHDRMFASSSSDSDFVVANGKQQATAQDGTATTLSFVFAKSVPQDDTASSEAVAKTSSTVSLLFVKTDLPIVANFASETEEEDTKEDAVAAFLASLYSTEPRAEPVATLDGEIVTADDLLSLTMSRRSNGVNSEDNLLSSLMPVEEATVAQAPAQPITQYGKTTTKGVNVRSWSKASAAVVATIPVTGTYLTIDEEILSASGEMWYAVTYKNKKGYVRGDLLELTSEEEYKIASGIAVPAPQIARQDIMQLGMENGDPEVDPEAENLPLQEIEDEAMPMNLYVVADPPAGTLASNLSVDLGMAAAARAAERLATAELQAEAEQDGLQKAKSEQMVWISKTAGNVYHRDKNCINHPDAEKIPISEARKQGLRPCATCY